MNDATGSFVDNVCDAVGTRLGGADAGLACQFAHGLWFAVPPEELTSRLPDELAIRTAYIRVFLIGLVLQIFLQKFPQGILPEQRPKP